MDRNGQAEETKPLFVPVKLKGLVQAQPGADSHC